MAEPNKVDCSIPVPGCCLETTLPENLKKDVGTIRKGVEQWSRITAWSWTDYLAFADGTESERDQEQKLKNLVIETLKKQAQYADAYISYGDNDSRDAAERYAQYLLHLLLGQNECIPMAQGITITLSDLMMKITGEPLITTANKTFGKLFLIQVVTNSFSGKITEAPPECATEETPYKNFVSYPPRPELGPLTVTYEDLRAWASNTSRGQGYLPPSAYIPTAFC